MLLFGKQLAIEPLNFSNISDVYSEGEGMGICVSNCHALIAHAVILSNIKSVRHLGWCVAGISCIVAWGKCSVAGGCMKCVGPLNHSSELCSSVFTYWLAAAVFRHANLWNDFAILSVPDSCFFFLYLYNVNDMF